MTPIRLRGAQRARTLPVRPPSVAVITDEVAAALRARKPIVALESALITHGLPRPENAATARALDETVREAGATPALIAIMDGRIRIGLNPEDSDRLAAESDPVKVSRADLAATLASGRNGGTTVAATMICAHLAGIGVFATGGIGGVHRGFDDHMDVSADLEELARTPVLVVSSGAKAILDLPKTFEMLETKGVPVVAYGTDTLPAFYCRDSGLPASHRMDTPDAVAELVRQQRALGLNTAILLANPVAESVGLPRSEFETLLSDALAQARTAGVVGKALTPFLLRVLSERSGGRTLEANRRLILDNAALAARIATALAV